MRNVRHVKHLCRAFRVSCNGTSRGLEDGRDQRKTDAKDLTPFTFFDYSALSHRVRLSPGWSKIAEHEAQRAATFGSLDRLGCPI